MGSSRQQINQFLVEAFHEILKTEELALASYAPDLTLREFHLIEEICQAQDRGTDDRATAIAASQRITAGTLTTAATQLEKKGYILRRRDEKDRRVVHLLPTEKGRQANRQHSCFHVEMVHDVLDTLTREETEVLAQALERIARFFRRKAAKECFKEVNS